MNVNRIYSWPAEFSSQIFWSGLHSYNCLSTSRASVLTVFVDEATPDVAMDLLYCCFLKFKFRADIIYEHHHNLGPTKSIIFLNYSVF